jgi:hypothetical protein
MPLLWRPSAFHNRQASDSLNTAGAHDEVALQKLVHTPCIRAANPLWPAFGVDSATTLNDQIWLPPCKDETGDG